MTILRKRIGLLPHRLHWLCIAVVAMLSIYIGTREFSKRLRWSAHRFADRGQFADATDRIRVADQLVGDPVADLLLRAKQQRHLGSHRQWQHVMSKLSLTDRSLLGYGQAEVELEQRLGSLRWPDSEEATEETFDGLLSSGAPLDDTAATYLLAITDRNTDRSEVFRDSSALVSRWENLGGSKAACAWGKGVALQSASDHTNAKNSFTNALAAEPNHDGAQIGLAQSLIELNKPQDAAKLFRAFLDRWPDSDRAALGLSRSLREMGRVEDAKKVIEGLIAKSNDDSKIWLESAEVAYLSGDFGEALRRFELADLSGSQTAITIRTAATAAVFAGQAPRGTELFDRYLAGRSRMFRIQSLQSRINLDPSDLESAKELQEILSGEGSSSPKASVETGEISALFSTHCASCHGLAGLGDGPANRHLYPRSRNLRDDPYRLVSTTNGLPSHDDIKKVIRNGIDGTAMRGLSNLSDADLDQLATQTLQLRQAGIKRYLLESMAELEVSIDAETLPSIESNLITPGEPIAIPDWPVVTAAMLSDGKRLFRDATCSQCHDQSDGGQIAFFDKRGMPAPPRNLATEPMKGGRDRGALFARIRLGMPGTMHPSSPTLSDYETVCLVEYCLSLAEEIGAVQTNHARLSTAHQYNLNSIKKAATSASDPLSNPNPDAEPSK
jgi:tetratricopeptide (TPR) repeat protein